MITEKQVVQYLKNKDQDYIDNLLERIKNSCSINVKSESKIICPICGLSSVKKNGKDSYEKQRYFCNVIDLLVKTLKHYFSVLILQKINGSNLLITK